MTIRDFYKYAQLATASYVDLSQEPSLSNQSRLASIADEQSRQCGTPMET